mgnify:FL=1
MDLTHDGIHREGNTFKLHSKCGINREFNTMKQFNLFCRLHKKKCEICKTDTDPLVILPQQYTTLENKKNDRSTKVYNECQNMKARKRDKTLKNAEVLDTVPKKYSVPKTKMTQPVSDPKKFQFVVDHDASKKAVIRRSAISETKKLKEWESKNAKYLESQKKNVKGWKEPIQL